MAFSSAEAAAQLIGSKAVGVGSAAGVLATLLGNLAKEPANAKFRRVPTTNARIKAALALPGAEALLVSSGFERADEAMIVPAEMADIEAQALAASALSDLDEACVEEGLPFLVALRMDHMPHGARCCCAVGHGTTLASGAMDNLIRLWPGHANADGVWCTNEARVVMEGHESARGADGVLCLRALPEATGAAAASGSLFASSGRDGRILVWRAPLALTKPPELVATLLGHGDSSGADVSNSQVVVALAPLPDGRLASVGWDQTLRVWPSAAVGGDAAAAAAHSVLGAKGVLGAACLAVCATADGTIAAGYGDGIVRLWNEANPGSGDFGAKGSFSTETVVRGLASLSEGGLAQCGNDGVLRIWKPDAAGTYSEAARSEPVRIITWFIIDLEHTITHPSLGGQRASLNNTKDSKCNSRVNPMYVCTYVYVYVYIYLYIDYLSLSLSLCIYIYTYIHNKLDETHRKGHADEAQHTGTRGCARRAQ